MAVHVLKVSTILIIVSAIIAHVTSERVYIVASPKQECPGQPSGEQCLTLQQFVTGNYTTNSTSLQILPGIHQIDLNNTTISVSTIYSFEVNGSNATILCNSNYMYFKFRKIDRINIHGVRLMGCRGTSFTSVDVLTVHDTHFEHHGPIILNSVFNATITNSSIVNGHKLLVHSSTLLINTALFSNLTAIDNYFEWNWDQYGGAMQINNSNITIEQCVFLNNFLYPFNSSIDSWGGAVYANNTRLLVIDSIFTRNSALEAGGAISANNTLVQINNTLFSNNLAIDKGGAIHNIVGPHTTSSILVFNCSFISNTAALAGALCTTGNNIDIIIRMSLFYSNAANITGGVLFVAGMNNSVTIQHSRFTDNVAEYSYGGVLYITGSYSMVNISQSMFNQNEASENAGVFYIENSSLSILQSSFDGNIAGLSGGAIYWYAASSQVSTDISHSNFSNNLAFIDGGVMYVNSSGSQVNVTDSTFANNNVTERGGVIAIFGSQLYFDQNIIFNNYGGIINACRSNVTASDDLKQIVEPNSNNSYCSFYDEYQDMPTADMNTTETTEASFTSFTSEVNTTPGTSSSETTTTPGTEANTMPGTNETPASPHLTTKPTTPNSTEMEGHSVMPTIPNIYTTAIYTTLGIAIVVCVLLALLYIIVMCIMLYLCGVFKSKKRLVDNPYLYVPMKENESTADNEIAAQE